MLRRLRSPSERGQVLVLTAIVLAVMFGFLALIVDAGFAYAARRDLQNGADNAALAGTKKLAEKQSAANIEAEVVRFVTAHGGTLTRLYYVDETRTDIGNVVSGAPVPANARGVGVVAARQVDTYFVGILQGSGGSPKTDVGAQAMAVYEWGQPLAGVGGLVPLGIPMAALASEGTEYPIWDPSFNNPPYDTYGLPSNYKGLVDYIDYDDFPRLCQDRGYEYQTQVHRLECWASWGFEDEVPLDVWIPIKEGDVGSNIGDKGLEENIDRQCPGCPASTAYGEIYTIVFDAYAPKMNCSPNVVGNHDCVRVAGYAKFRIYKQAVHGSSATAVFVGIESDRPGPGTGHPGSPIYIRLVEPGTYATPQPTATSAPTPTTSPGVTPTATATSVPTVAPTATAFFTPTSTATATPMGTPSPCVLNIVGTPWTIATKNNKLDVHWVTDFPANSEVRWSGFSGGSAADASLVTDHVVTTGMQDSKEYSYTVTSIRDCGGGNTRSASATGNYP